jgi:quinol monooxygenase YgiN
MPVTCVIKFQVVPEQRERFLDLLGGVLDAIWNTGGNHSRRGCLGILLFRADAATADALQRLNAVNY